MPADFPFLPLRYKSAGMSKSKIPETEIIPPNKAEALDQLEARQAQEWAAFQPIKSLATTMDAKFKIPGVPFPIGLDAIVGLIPGIGDTISLGVAGYIVARGWQFGLGSHRLFQMVFNIFIDWLIGLVPVIGDLFDVGWQGNLRNTRIIEEALEKRWAKERAELIGE